MLVAKTYVSFCLESSKIDNSSVSAAIAEWIGVCMAISPYLIHVSRFLGFGWEDTRRPLRFCIEYLGINLAE